MNGKILIFPNTPWERDALAAVFSNGRATPNLPGYVFPPVAATAATVNIPGRDGLPNYTATAKLTYDQVEVWCVYDLLPTDPVTKKKIVTTEGKAYALSVLSQARGNASVLVAFGTSAFADQQSYDGCVIVGSNYFNYSPFTAADNIPGFWDSPSLGQFIENSGQTINQQVFAALKDPLRLQIESRFLRPPVDSAETPYLIVSPGYTAISDVNVANGDDYAWADRQALAEFAAAQPRKVVGSVETTHGVIAESVAHDQFLFFSAIADRLGYFNMEAAPRNYAQDFAVAHNAAVALAWLLPTLISVAP